MSRDLNSLLSEAERDATDNLMFDMDLAIRSIELTIERDRERERQRERDREREARDKEGR